MKELQKKAIDNIIRLEGQKYSQGSPMEVQRLKIIKAHKESLNYLKHEKSN